jgi:hypothetical protein
MDKVGSTSSHHLLSAFEFAAQSELDEFYTKIRAAFGGANNTGNLSNALAVTRTSEYEIVGPQPVPGSQTVTTDTTLSASPYIFNCSIRSNYGLCGVYADGAKTSGFRSLVVAQFTGVSLQRDLNCWQKYDSSQSTQWGNYFANYAEYISTSPNNVRMSPNRRSFHIRAVNNSLIQEVSVFAIGQGVHHWTQNGGEITITNSNSNFGGCAAISEGYRSVAAPADTNWNVSKIRVATNLADKTNNVQRIYLGTITAITSTTITLSAALGESTAVTGVPDIVASKGYTLRNTSRVWVENPQGADWSSTFGSSAWSTGAPTVLNIAAAIQNEANETPAIINSVSSAVGKRVYIRRLVDTRSPDERRFTIQVNSTAQGCRTPVRDYVLQTNTAGGSITSTIGGNNLVLVTSSTKRPTTGLGVLASSEVVLRRGNTTVAWTSGVVYKRGDTVQKSGKHYTCIQENTDISFDVNKWDEAFVHMASDYNPEDFYKNEIPVITFDNDTASSEDSTTLGYNLSTAWTSDSLISNQYRVATDYRGIHLFLTALGFTSNQAHNILVPQGAATRDRDPSLSADMGGYVPSGAANALANWPVQFRRPSVIRLFGHAWEWAGYLNYTKAIPAYQGDLSSQNKFTSYFTNVNGGRVYATGFNEEGFQVSPRGLEDIVTGSTLTVENLGASDLTLAPITSLTGVTLNGTTTVPSGGTLNIGSGATVNIEGNLSLPASARATTATQGIGEIASIGELSDATQVTSDTSLNTAGARFITPEGLEYWRVQRKLISQKTGSTTFFIVPDNAVMGGTYVFNGTSYTLTMNPSRSQTELTANQAPNTPTRAVKFSVAVQFANADLAGTETANYYLANGCYWTAVEFRHIANVYGAYSSFPDTNEVNTSFESGSTPTTNVKGLYDNYLIPTFGAYFSGYTSSFYNTSQIFASSANLRFTAGGGINGIAFVGMDKMIADSTNWPNDLFQGGASYRSNGANPVASYANSWYAINGGSTTFYHYYQSPRISSVNGSVTVRNVISGPGLPGRGGKGSGLDSSLIDVRNSSISMAGIYLLGNVCVTPADLPAIVNKATTNVTGCQHMQALISGYDSDNTLISVSFPYYTGTSPTATTNAYNYDANCVHILTSSGTYGTVSSKASGTVSQRGATFRSIIGVLGPGTKLSTGGYDSYRIQGVPTNKHHGFAGTFGNAIDYQALSSGTDYSPTSVTFWNTIDTERLNSYVNYLFQQAVTGTAITGTLPDTGVNGANADTNTNNQAGGIYYAYSTTGLASNVLNINSFYWRRGVNSNSGGRNSTSFYG